MDKNSAINLIDKTFNRAFDEAKFTNFIQNLLNDFEIKPYKASGNTIWEDQRDHISYYKRIGKYIDPEGEALDVLIVQVKNVSKLERARTALRNFVIKHLNNFEKDYALIAFYSKEDQGFDWRFSFVKREIQAYMDEETQKVKMRKEFTPAKRYSFLVGEYEKSHTAKTQLLPLLQNIANNPTIAELEKAFSIERVTDEFFEQYKSLYIKVYEHFDKRDVSIFENGQLDASGFTKKLLGQIVFLYFLQKKGWLGVPKNEKWGNGKRDFLQQLYDESLEKNKNFFKDYLQYLFYEALAKERDNDNSFYPRFNGRIPFLNGGLFEAQYDWKNANISIPTHLFRNDEKNKSGDTGTGILDVFDRYNFTIKEDEPLDKEVAVDPEMLGKVFENMLEIKERKSKGAFYTPREIVHYMCQESLIHYLDNALNNNSTYKELGENQINLFGNSSKNGQLSIQAEFNEVNVPKKDIEQYIREGHLALENDVRVAERGETKTYQFQLPESVRNNADVIDKKLTEIRICDPAIGSGAFPLGLLHELVIAQLVLKPHLSYGYLNNKLVGFGFRERESVNESRYVYRLKKHIIQESIYGVDIDRSAIDIARLRLWLSLVVDEDDLEPIETLPNLDYKIVSGNSLIGMPYDKVRDFKIEKELEDLKEEFFVVTNEFHKKELRNKIDSKIRELLDNAESFTSYKIDFDFKLYFSEIWREKGGFDIVIGNPPYVRVQEIDKFESSIYKQNYRGATGSYDLYIIFSEMGSKLINEQGVLTYILPHKWTHSSYGLGFRKYLSSSKLLSRLISFDSYQVFKATTYSSIIFLDKTNEKFLFTKLDHDINSLNHLENFLNNLDSNSYTIYNKRIGSNPLQLVDASIKKIFDDLKVKCKPLNDIASHIFQGIKTSKDSVYVLKNIEDSNDGYIKGYSEILDKTVKLEKEITRPLLKGSDFHRYDTLKPDRIVILPYNVLPDSYSLYTENQLESKFPLTYSYLLSNKTVLENRERGRLKGDAYWYRFIYPKNLLLFPMKKIIISEVSYGSNMVLDKNETHHIGQYSLLLKNENSHRYEALLAVLNSEFCWFFISQTGSVLRGGYYAYRPDYLKPLPIPELNIQNSLILKTIVEYIIVLKNLILLELEIDFYEILIDSVVYELYFQGEFQSANKTILKHLKDLKHLEEGMTDAEKISVIHTEYERLYHPDHPVRYAIETIDSIEEVRIIKEAIK